MGSITVVVALRRDASPRRVMPTISPPVFPTEKRYNPATIRPCGPAALSEGLRVPQRILFHELTREELNARATESIVLLPTGATEQHGPHLPTGTDTYAVEHIVQSAAARIADQAPVLVAPTLPFGCSPHHLAFGGTMSLSSQTYYAVIRDLVESLITDGFSRVLVINGHGGNHELIQLVVRDLALEYPVNLGAASYWQMAMPELLETDSPALGRTPGHAGNFETSLVMALQPDLVVEPRPRPRRASDPSLIDPVDLTSRLRIERHDAWQRFDGYTDSPANASAEAGQTYLEAAITGVASTIQVFHERTKDSG
jgi:creatinine amidohydrolase